MAAKKKAAGKAAGKKHKAAGDVIWFRKARKPRQPNCEPVAARATYTHTVDVVTSEPAPETGGPSKGVLLELNARYRAMTGAWHAKSLALGYDGVDLMIDAIGDMRAQIIDDNEEILRLRELTQHPTLWIVGRFYAETWDFQGVFWNEPEAVAACVDDTWFVAPAQIGVALPVEPQPWPGLYYPVPPVEEQPAGATAADHRAYRWGLVAVCLVVLAAIGFGLAGCAP